MAKSDYYSKQNPHGHHGSTPRPPLGAGHEDTSDHREGFSTRKNINEWAARASANSGPGLVLDTAQRATKDRGRAEQDRNHSVKPRVLGWAPERGE